MKYRVAFVSNSSSSSFICENKAGFTVEHVKEILQRLFEMHSKLSTVKYPEYEYYPKTFDDMFKEPRIVEKNESPGLFRFYIDEWQYGDDWRFRSLGISEIGDFEGKLIINSVSDNTIPHSLFELIEWIFDGYRIHLG